MPDYVKSGRQDLIDNLNKEIEVLLTYLPKQLTEDEIRAIVEEAVKETGVTTMKDMGKVMGAATKKLAGQADGRLISTIVKELLAQ